MNGYRNRIKVVFEKKLLVKGVVLTEELVEIKHGCETLTKEEVEILTSLAKHIDTTRMKSPAYAALKMEFTLFQ